MTPHEKFQFDLEGYLVVPGVLGADELAALNAACDDPPAGEWNDTGAFSAGRVSGWGPAFQSLIDHPNLLPYLVELMGPRFRLDHDYCIFMRTGAGRGGLHGGPSPQSGEGDHWYRYQDGIIRNGLTVFTYCLSDHGPGAGGFGCIPGSHKSNFIGDIPREVRAFERPAHYVRQVEAAAGDVIIFTEALVHGTMPWTAAHDRRGLLYKYSPGHSSWAASYYDADDYPDVTEQQRRILTPPSVGRREDSVQTD